MSYYEIQDVGGSDFVCLIKDHTRRTTSKCLVRAQNEYMARLAFRGERGISVIAVSAKP